MAKNQVGPEAEAGAGAEPEPEDGPELSKQSNFTIRKQQAVEEHTERENENEELLVNSDNIDPKAPKGLGKLKIVKECFKEALKEFTENLPSDPEDYLIMITIL